MHRVEKGLVLRAVPYRDADAMLTILTECDGKLTAAARGVRRKGSRISAAVECLAYSEFTLYGSGDRFTVNEAEPIELFYPLRGDLVSLSLANYFAEVLSLAADEEVANPELLRLGLNSLYALSKKMYDMRIIKAAFELKIAAFSGYAPSMSRCGICGCEITDGVCFDKLTGSILCSRCAGGRERTPAGVIAAIRYILSADVRRLFSFKLDEGSISELSRICECYLTEKFDREFKTLTFYKSVLC